ncbi:MAG: hypothetical protein HYX46_16365 [Betaproteobacteria bacterium]|nr:hypothetical protein [Betaproteobacteria bacterium]
MPYSELVAQYPVPGTVVWVWGFLFLRHRGIVSDRWYGGRPMVIASSWGNGVIEEPWDEFRAGQQVYEEGYLGQLPAHEVLWRARSRIGTAYRIADSNCDHLVNYAHGLPVISEQIREAATVVMIGIALFAVASKK